jgi:hypothetical protein
MRSKGLAMGGAVVLAATAALSLSKLVSKSRLAVRRATAVTHRSGVSNPGVPATADPARGLPA